jgi:hypothetical protein
VSKSAWHPRQVWEALPVQQSVNVALIINLITAKALGMTLRSLVTPAVE